MGYNMSLNKIDIYIETNTKIEYKKYTIYKTTLYLKTILLKNVFLKRSEWMAGIHSAGIKYNGKSYSILRVCYFAMFICFWMLYN